MTRYAVVLLAEGFEEAEAVITVDVLRRLNINVKTVSLSNNYELVVPSCRNVQIKADIDINDLNADEIGVVVLPGGMPGASNLRDNEAVIDLLKYVYSENEGLIAAICAAPIALDKAGLLKDKNYTCYPGFEKQINDGNYTAEPTTVDGRVITGFGPAAAFCFGAEIALFLGTSEQRITELFSAMQFDRLK
ncbi:DJ-1 family glyoxalase III [Lentisphaerota bacterium WC36G]|nr:DJ-1/PfpI family protein [Lentisphaerae bacterium WC36]